MVTQTTQEQIDRITAEQVNGRRKRLSVLANTLRLAAEAAEDLDYFCAAHPHGVDNYGWMAHLDSARIAWRADADNAAAMLEALGGEVTEVVPEVPAFPVHADGSAIAAGLRVTHAPPTS